jgi:hypothetical protein
MFRATWRGVTTPADAIVLTAIDAPAVTPRHDSGHDKPQRKAPPARRPAAMTKQARAVAAIRDNPGMANAALARLAGCDVRTISRARNAGRKP